MASNAGDVLTEPAEGVPGPPEARRSVGIGCLCSAILAGTSVSYCALFCPSLMPPAAALILGVLSLAWAFWVSALAAGYFRLPRALRNRPLLLALLGFGSLAFVGVAYVVTATPPGVALPVQYRIARGEPTGGPPLGSLAYWIAPYLKPVGYSGTYLYVRDVATGRCHRIAGPAETLDQVKWSPDGEWIAFRTKYWAVGRDEMHWYANIVPAAGGRLVRAEASQNGFAWSPGGDEITFETEECHRRSLGTSGEQRDLPPLPPVMWHPSRPPVVPPVQLPQDFRPYWEPSWAADARPGLSYAAYPGLVQPSAEGTREAFSYPGRGCPFGAAWVTIVYLVCAGAAPLAMAVGRRSRAERGAASLLRWSTMAGTVTIVVFSLAVGVLVLSVLLSMLSRALVF